MTLRKLWAGRSFCLQQIIECIRGLHAACSRHGKECRFFTVRERVSKALQVNIFFDSMEYKVAVRSLCSSFRHEQRQTFAAVPAVTPLPSSRFSGTKILWLLCIWLGNIAHNERKVRRGLFVISVQGIFIESSTVSRVVAAS